MLDVSVIIVSYNTRELLRACIRSISTWTRGVTYEMIVIDNNSTDDTQQMLWTDFPEVILVSNRDNRGFGAANNQGMAVAQGRYLLLLNSDTKLQSDLLADLHAFAESRPDAGVVSGRLVGSDGLQQRAMFRYPTLTHVAINMIIPKRIMKKSRFLGRANYVGYSLDEERDVDIVGGCCMLIRREVFQQTGGFDETFFMYAEEFEWCYRIRGKGWRILYTPNASVVHYGGQSTAAVSDRMHLEMARSHVLLFYRIYGAGTAFVANLMMAVRDLPRALLWRCLPVGPFARFKADAMRFNLHAMAICRPFWTMPPHYRRESAMPGVVE